MTGAALAAPGPVAPGGVDDARRYAETRPGTVAFALATPDGRVRGHNADLQFRSASITKAMLLVAVLRDARHRALTRREQALLGPMITKSDNKAADRVYAKRGDAALAEVAKLARMRHFLPVGALYEARITAADQARLFLRIDRLVPTRHRAYARELLSGVIRPHRWGIATVGARRGFDVFFKSGWRRRVEHQVALLERGGRRIALAVLTSDTTTGRATQAGIAARILARSMRETQSMDHEQPARAGS